MESYLKHYGVKGMKKGVNRYYNPDGTLTAEGRRHYKIGANDKIHYTSNGFTSTSSDGRHSVGVARFMTPSNKKPASNKTGEHVTKDGWHVSPFKPVGNSSAKAYPAGAKGPGSLRSAKAYPAGAKGPGSLRSAKAYPAEAKGPGSLRSAKAYPAGAKGPGSLRSAKAYPAGAKGPGSLLRDAKPTSDRIESIPLKPKKASDEKKPMSLKKKDRAKKLVKRPNYSTLRLTDLR